jgi:signal transduction histidine kinase/ligand-binding sensor domain-containing protein
MTLFASAGARAEEPAAASPGQIDASSSPTPSTNAAWLSRAWQTEDGLPGNTVVGVAQTPDGFLWVATESGLARFDGVRFQEIAPLPNPNLSFLADHRGRLWLGKRTATAGGEVVCLEAGKSRVFTTEDGLPDRGASGMAEDGEGAVWFSAGPLCCRIQDGRGTLFSSEAGLPSVGGKLYLASDSQGQIWFARGSQAGVYRDGRFRMLLTLKGLCGTLSGARSGGVWIGAGTRVLKYSGEGEPQDLGELAAGRPDVKPTVLYEDRRGRLWVGTERAGLFLYNGAGFEEVALARREILCLTNDREGNLWVGSRGGGLIRVRPRAFELEVLVSAPSPDAMQSLCQEASGMLWAVTQSGRLARKEGPLWRALSAEDGWSGPLATCVTPAPEGGVWVGTLNGGLRQWRQGEVRALTRQDGLVSQSVTAMLTTPSGDVWVGTLDPNAVQRLRDSQFQTLMLPQVYGHFGSLAVDASGGVWAATEGGLLTRVSREGLLDQTTNTLGEHLTITSLCATPDGSLWIGYHGLGVGRLRQGRFTRFGTEHGLPDDYIVHILADGRGRLWFAANRGLFSVAEEEFEEVAEGRQARVRPVVYGQEEGVPVSQAYRGRWPGALRSADGRLWIPMVIGLLVVDLSRLTENREPPPVVLERVVVDGQTVAVYECGPGPRAPGSALPLDLHQFLTAHEPLGAPTFLSASGNEGAKPTGMSALPGRSAQTPALLHSNTPSASEMRLCLAPGPRQVALDYTALSFVSPRNVAFKYRLAGLEHDWVEAGTRRTAYYSRLPPGDYRFEVMACNNDGVWSEGGASLALTVLPHFWQTWWFIVPAVLTALGAAVGTARQVERRRGRRKLEALERQQALERERTRIARDIHDELGTSLTRIIMLSQPEDEGGAPAQAEVSKIHETARDLTRTMDEVVWAVNPRQDTLEGLVSYVSLFAQEYLAAANLGCRLELPDRLPPLPLSAEARHNVFLAVKEAIHNAVRHARAREIRIALRIGARAFTLEVTDDGIGFDPDAAAVAQTGQPTRRKGQGLRNIRERLSALGGRCEINSLLHKGTTVRFIVPLPAPVPCSEN